jgi:hypothetical protein
VGRDQAAKTSRGSFRDDGSDLSCAGCLQNAHGVSRGRQEGAINVVPAHEQACQTYDFDKLDSLHTSDSRGIEESYPHPFEPDERRDYQAYNYAGMRIDYPWTAPIEQNVQLCQF